MKVYVVTMGIFYNYSVVGVFSDMEKAEACVKAGGEDAQEKWVIDEAELDPPC